MSASPLSASFRLCRCRGDSVSTTSNVGRTYASMRWPPIAMPSARLTTTCRCRRRLAVGPKGDVAKERDDLDLLGDGNFPVVLRLPIEETEHCITAGADAGELGGRNTALAATA